MSDGNDHIQHEHEHSHIGLGIRHAHIHHHSAYGDPPGGVPFESPEHGGTKHVHSPDHAAELRARTPRSNGTKNDIVDAALYLGDIMEKLTRELRSLNQIIGDEVRGLCPFCHEAVGTPREATLHILSTHQEGWGKILIDEVPA